MFSIITQKGYTLFHKDGTEHETVFCHLLSKEHLSYYIHKSLLNSKRLYKLMRDYNNNYHKNPNNKDYLSFCIVKTIFTNDSIKHYVYVEDLGKTVIV